MTYFPSLRPAAALSVATLLLLVAACGSPPAPPTAATSPAASPALSAATSAAASTASALSSTSSVVTPADDAETLHIQSRETFPTTLDPHLSSYTNEIGATAMVYEGLTRLSSTLEATPAAAEEWQLSPSGDVITFTLRADLRYSDGSPLAAPRFQDAVVRSCDPTLAAPYSYVLFDVVACEALYTTPVSDTAALERARQTLRDAVTAPDARTLVVHLTHPTPYFPYIAGLWVMYPVKQELIEAGGADWWRDAAQHIGNGPFTMTELDESRLTFRPNAHYWDGPPRAAAITYQYVFDSAVALQAYQAGQLDIMVPDASQLTMIEDDATLSQELVKYAGANTILLLFNLDTPPFNDAHVRKAFAYALDRDTACRVVFNGGCVPALSWIPEGVAGSIQTDAFAFDPEQARAELAASDYGSAEQLPPITLTYASGDPAVQPRIEWLAQQFREVLGVTITLAPLDPATLAGLVADHATFPQMTISSWYQDYPDAQNWMGVLWDSRSAWAQQVGFHDDTFDQLSRAADRELDSAKRTTLYEQAGRRLVELQPAVFMHHNAVYFLVKPRVAGYTTTVSDVNWPGEWGSRVTIHVTP